MESELSSLRATATITTFSGTERIDDRCEGRGQVPVVPGPRIRHPGGQWNSSLGPRYRSRKLVREERAALASLVAEVGDNVWLPLLSGPQRAAYVAVREPPRFRPLAGSAALQGWAAIVFESHCWEVV